MDQPWKQRSRPERCERRVEFADYEATRVFLERLNQLSERLDKFPDISFGRTYVNLTVRPEEGQAFGEAEQSFIAAIDELL
jgi:4a-hydroxytetrahydrobiopterin dehydratase